jgi:electron transfer flavoprotein alpha subunit
VKKTLIYLDPDAPVESLELLEVMEQMYGPGGSSSYGFCLGKPGQEIMSVLDHVICIEDDHLEPHDIINLTNCIEELQQKYVFDAILIPATTFGRMLAPRAAMRLHVGLVADVTAIRHRNGEVQMVRPAFSGRMLAGVVNLGRVPVMMTVRRSVFSYDNRRSKRAEILKPAPRTLERPRVRLVERRVKPEARDIRESDVLVSGGGGVLRSFDQLEALAQALGGTVSASRKVVDSGKAPRHIQVGQSGKTVSPRLYVALGISGSIQHVVGLKNAEYVIAVNSNKHAPICSLSDIVVEGDAREFIPRMVARIEQSARTDIEARQGEER